MRNAQVLLVCVALASSGSAGCKGEDGAADAGPDADAADADADSDGIGDADWPPLECGDDPQNLSQCMLGWPDGGPEDGIWCDGRCRPVCGAEGECPGSLVCHVAGTFGLCFEQ